MAYCTRCALRPPGDRWVPDSPLCKWCRMSHPESTCRHRVISPVKVIKANGLWEPRETCPDCGVWWGGVKQRDIRDQDALPIWRDRRSDENPCERCGRTDTEFHHWAPRAAFSDADEWPRSWLCRGCHTLWHRIMQPAEATRQDDLAGWTVELNGWDDVNTLEHNCGYSHEVAPSAPLADLLAHARAHVCT